MHVTSLATLLTVSRTLSDQAVEDGTGRSWSSWVELFDRAGGATLSHQELVQVAADAGAASWWRQMVSVAYEQHLGRRVVGQGRDGAFAVSVTKTLRGSMDDALANWVATMSAHDDLCGVVILEEPAISRTPKWRYWRCSLADGSRVVVNIATRAPGKSALSVQHEKLESAELIEHWRAFWKGVLATLA